VSALLNQRCVLALDIESMFRVEMLKILLQQYLPLGDLSKCSKLSQLFDHLVGALLEMHRFVEAKRHQLVGLGAEHGARVLEPWATFCLVRDDNCNPHRDAA
jgi:hypothetical protein